jgi:hypothetical protein
MPTFVVFPLDELTLQLYVGNGHALREGVLIAGDRLTPERAALAVKGQLDDASAVRKFAVVDATLIDFEPVPGQETMRADEGPHREPWEQPSHTGDDHDDLSNPARPA